MHTKEAPHELKTDSPRATQRHHKANREKMVTKDQSPKLPHSDIQRCERYVGYRETPLDAKDSERARTQCGPQRGEECLLVPSVSSNRFESQRPTQAKLILHELVGGGPQKVLHNVRGERGRRSRELRRERAAELV